MAASFPPTVPPVTSVDEAIDGMQRIDATLPKRDGLACFNRMYLEITQQVQSRIDIGFFANPAFMSTLDVVFANVYFGAVNAILRTPHAVPTAWRPLARSRSNPGIYSIQFALAGMNAHINHDLPIALVRACSELGTSPDAGSNHADYQKVDELLDAAEQSVRHSFEGGEILKADRSVQTVLDLVDNWSITSARDGAWATGQALWRCRGDTMVEDLIMSSVASTVAMASRCLLVVPEPEPQIPWNAVCDRVWKSMGVLIHG